MGVPGAICLLLLATTTVALGQVQTLTPPGLDTIVVDMYRATETGSILMETQASLGTEDDGSWSFLLRPHVFTNNLQYTYFMNSAYINNAACVYFSVASNFSTVHAYLTTEAGVNNVMNIQQGTFNISNSVPLSGANYTNVRSAKIFAATNTSGVYALQIVNTGGQAKDHSNFNASATTQVALNLGAYDSSSPVCQNATAAQPGPLNTSLSTNQTLNILRGYYMSPKDARMMAAFSNISCIAYQLLSEDNYTQVNSSGFVPTASLERDMTVAITNSTSAIKWASDGFPQSMPIIGQYCFQRSLKGIAPSNATAIFGSGTQASNVTTVAGDIMVNATQTCQMVVDNLDPVQEYIIWAVNGLNTAASTNASASVRFAARPSGSCAYLEFPAPSYEGDPVPAEYVVTPTPPGPPPPPLTTAEIIAEIYNLLPQVTEQFGPKGAPAPAPYALPIGDVPLPPGVPNISSFVEYTDSFQESGIAAPAPSSGQITKRAPERAPSPAPERAIPIKEGRSKLSPGAIAGIAIGAVGALFAAVAAGLLYRRSRRPPVQPPPSKLLEPIAPGSSGSSLDSGDQAFTGGAGSLPTDSRRDISVAESQTSDSRSLPQVFLSRLSTERTIPPPMAFLPPDGKQEVNPSLQLSLESSATPPGVFSPLPGYDSAKKSIDGLPQASGVEQPGAERSLGREPSGSGSLPSQSSIHEFWLKPKDLEYVRDSNGELKVLGKGGGGKVYDCLLSGLPVAVKELDLKHDSKHVEKIKKEWQLEHDSKHVEKIEKEWQLEHDSKHAEKVKKEWQLLKDCRHPNIVTLIGALHEDDKVKLVMERLECTYSDLRKCNKYPELRSWNEKGWQVALGVARALAYLHARKTAHFDVKSDNVLLAADGTAKLIDYGISKEKHTHQPTENEGYTFDYAAPEVLNMQRCTVKVDIWSYGTFLIEIITAEPPDRRRPMAKIRVPEQCPQEVANLCERCTQFEPEKRPTARQVVEILENIYIRNNQA